MIEEEKLDIRTVTMGISLLDCADSNGAVARQKIYDKITSRAKNLVSVCEGIEAELGIPIVNKRIAVTPIAVIAGASSENDYIEYARTLDAAAKAVGVLHWRVQCAHRQRRNPRRQHAHELHPHRARRNRRGVLFSKHWLLPRRH